MIYRPAFLRQSDITRTRTYHVRTHVLRREGCSSAKTRFVRTESRDLLARCVSPPSISFVTSHRYEPFQRDLSHLNAEDPSLPIQSYCTFRNTAASISQKASSYRCLSLCASPRIDISVNVRMKFLAIRTRLFPVSGYVILEFGQQLKL